MPLYERNKQGSSKEGSARHPRALPLHHHAPNRADFSGLRSTASERSRARPHAHSSPVNALPTTLKTDNMSTHYTAHACTQTTNTKTVCKCTAWRSQAWCVKISHVPRPRPSAVRCWGGAPPHRRSGTRTATQVARHYRDKRRTDRDTETQDTHTWPSQILHSCTVHHHEYSRSRQSGAVVLSSRRM
jgi:hypothetical protein